MDNSSSSNLQAQTPTNLSISDMSGIWFCEMHLAKIMTADGYDIKKVEVINDRGIHICKSMLAYKLFWNNAEPDKEQITS